MDYFNDRGYMCHCRRCNGIIHTIRQGDTLYSLGRQHNVSVTDIIDANPYINVYNLSVGMEICIPTNDSNSTGDWEDMFQYEDFINNPGNAGTMPDNMGTMPNNMGGMPNNMGSMPGMGTMPNNMGSMPGMGTTPNNMGSMPGMGTMPNNMGSMPGMGTMPNNMGSMPGMGYMPNNMGSMPNNMNGMPGMGYMPNSMSSMSDIGCMSDNTGSLPGENSQEGMETTPDSGNSNNRMFENNNSNALYNNMMDNYDYYDRNMRRQE